MASLFGNMLAQRNTNTTYTAASATPKAAGTAAVGTSAKYAREDHVHPAQTTVSGNAGSATKLATARTIGISGAVTGTATAFDGTKNINIPITALNVSKATTGILAVARGGTGQSTVAGLQSIVTGYNHTQFDDENVNLSSDETSTFIPGSVRIGKDAGTNYSSIVDDTELMPTVNIGYQTACNALSSISGAVTIGYMCAQSSTGLGNSVLIGAFAGQNVKGLTNSVIIGSKAAQNGTQHTTSVVIGSEVASIGAGSTQTFSNNVLIGPKVLAGLTPGTGGISNNAIIGNQSGKSWGTGSTGNSILGTGAGTAGTSGSTVKNSVAIGMSSKLTGSAPTNAIAIGYGSSATNNEMQLGNTSITVYAQKALATRSDERDKANITDLEYPYKDFIMKLRPVNYQWDAREDYCPDDEYIPLSKLHHDGTHIKKRRHNGFIAQQVKQVADELGFDFAGFIDNKINGGEDKLNLIYEEFIAPMVACIQDLIKENEELKQKVAIIEAKLEGI